MARTFEGFIKGINLGGWLSQVKPENAGRDEFITEEDIRTISSFGVDHIRLPIDYDLVEDEAGAVREEGYGYIDNCIRWCLENNLNLVLDLHKAAGYVFDDAAYSADFFHSEALMDRFINLWIRLAKRYGKYHKNVAFELLNEIVCPDVSDEWNDLAERAIHRIREFAPDTWILVGGTRNNSIVTLKELRPPVDSKIVFNFHCYEPLIFTHQAAYWVEGMPSDYSIDYPLTVQEYMDETTRLIDGEFAFPISHLADMMCGPAFFGRFFEEAVQVAEKYDVPLYCGEYGVIDRTAPEATLRWLQDIHAAFEKYGISRAVWTYKKMDFGITDAHYSSVFQEILKNL